MGAEFSRYIIAGVVNTAVGFLAFLCVLHLFDFGLLLANAVSYAVGLGVAYTLNILFVFESSRHSLGAASRFLLMFGIAYGISTTLLLMVDQLGIRAEFSQLLAMVAYTISFYLLNKYFVWQA